MSSFHFKRIICIGNLGIDRINFQNVSRKNLGGSAWRFAQIMAFMKIPTTIVSGIDSDTSWDKAIKLLETNNIRFIFEKISSLPTFYLHYNSRHKIKRFIVHNQAPIKEAIEHLVDKINLSSVKWVHICPIDLQLVKKIIDKVKKKKPISLQLHFSMFENNFFEQLTLILPKVDYLFVSQEDLILLEKKLPIEKITKTLCLVKRCVYLTKGREGVVLLEKDNFKVSIPAISLVEPKEVTGAGDAFAAGVVIGLNIFDNTIVAARLGILLSSIHITDVSSKIVYSFLKNSA